MCRWVLYTNGQIIRRPDPLPGETEDRTNILLEQEGTSQGLAMLQAQRKVHGLASRADRLGTVFKETLYADT